METTKEQLPEFWRHTDTRREEQLIVPVIWASGSGLKLLEGEVSGNTTTGTEKTEHVDKRSVRSITT